MTQCAAILVGAIRETAMPAVTINMPESANFEGVSPRRRLAASVVRQGTAAVNRDDSVGPKIETARVYTKIDTAPTSTPCTAA
jgi:hypothetical protein